ncbi:MAG: extensin family protein [Myxococcales bacterium]|nr:extensin family protein [Myxococcales bacterium]
MSVRVSLLAVAAAAVAAALVAPRSAHALGGVRLADDPTTAPAFKYGKLQRFECEAELTRRKVPFARVTGARGVLAPVRLTGPLHGVSFHGNQPARVRPQSPYEILDCRLVLALDDLAPVLAKHDVKEAVHMSVYRPPAARGWAEGQLGRRHDGALAIDLGSLIKNDGTTLSVERDFHGAGIGARTCGEGAPAPAQKEAQELRQIVCEAADMRLFNVQLTPHYNFQHRNHFHLEVTPEARWFLVR